jgi:hypothetical protein
VSSDDPERARFDALLAAHRRGEATAPQREELALYVGDDAERAAAVAANERAASLGQGWLRRVEDDDRLASIDGSRRAKIERGVGLALVATGWLLQFPLGVFGLALMGIGVLTVVYSLVRVRLAGAAKDPYKDVVR